MTTKRSDVVGRTDLIEVSGAKERAVAIELDAPVQAPDGSWSCAVRISGHDEFAPIVGADSLQSLSLALAFVRSQLDLEKYRFPDGGAFPMDAYFPAIPKR